MPAFGVTFEQRGARQNKAMSPPNKSCQAHVADGAPASRGPTCAGTQRAHIHTCTHKHTHEYPDSLPRRARSIPRRFQLPRRVPRCSAGRGAPGGRLGLPLLAKSRVFAHIRIRRRQADEDVDRGARKTRQTSECGRKNQRRSTQRTGAGHVLAASLSRACARLSLTLPYHSSCAQLAGTGEASPPAAPPAAPPLPGVLY